MTIVIRRLGIPPPRQPENKASLEMAIVQLNELSGAVGAVVQRAVRIGELINAGVVQLQPDGQLAFKALYVPVDSGPKPTILNSNLRIDFNIGGVTQLRIQNGIFRRRDATGNVMTAQPRIFVRPTDPGVLAATDDVWYDTSVSPPAIRVRGAGVWSAPNN